MPIEQPSPVWNTEGYPANAPAAAQDALEWLVFLRDNVSRIVPTSKHGDAPERLDRCMAALSELVIGTHLDDTTLLTPKRLPAGKV